MWKVSAAAVQGGRHLTRSQPCQDSVRHRFAGEALCAVVCDGAGSARWAEVGAQWVSAALVRRLHAAVDARRLALSVPHADAVSRIARIVATTRRDLRKQACRRRRAFSEHATTLVAAVLWPAGGWLVHIGDGAAVCTLGSGDAPIVSPPESGPYVGFTSFITCDDWSARLRITRVGAPVTSVAIMTDGAASFAMDRGCLTLCRRFMDPVLRYLEQVPASRGSEALATSLADPRTLAVTDDDKTLLIATWRAKSVRPGRLCGARILRRVSAR